MTDKSSFSNADNIQSEWCKQFWKVSMLLFVAEGRDMCIPSIQNNTPILFYVQIPLRIFFKQWSFPLAPINSHTHSDKCERDV